MLPFLIRGGKISHPPPVCQKFWSTPLGLCLSKEFEIPHKNPCPPPPPPAVYIMNAAL